MGWTYQDYISQPDWFIQTIIIKLSVESDYNRLRAKQTKHK